MGSIVTFRKPPVVETVLSTMFDTDRTVSAAHLGRFWETVADEFPTIEERPRFEMPIERLEVGGRQQLDLAIRFGSAESPRYWIISSDDQRLIQLQSDWFAYNWRKRAEPYRRYEDGRSQFERLFGEFSSFLAGVGLGTPSPRHCEVTYVNQVRAKDSEGKLLPAREIVSVLNPPSLSHSPAGPEGLQLRFHDLIESEESVLGRIHVNFQSARDDDGPYWRFELTARGKPVDSDVAGVLAFMDLGRDAIVRTFSEITTSRMHDEWEREQ